SIARLRALTEHSHGRATRTIARRRLHLRVAERFVRLGVERRFPELLPAKTSNHRNIGFGCFRRDRDGFSLWRAPALCRACPGQKRKPCWPCAGQGARRYAEASRPLHCAAASIGRAHRRISGLRPNIAFKPKLHRYANNMAEKSLPCCRLRAAIRLNLSVRAQGGLMRRLMMLSAAMLCGSGLA